MDYYYTDASNQTRGPVSLAELQQLATTGQVTPATMVAAVGSQQWVSITTVLPNLGAMPGPTSAAMAGPSGAIPPGMPITPGAPTEPLAIWSLVLGLLSIFCCGFFSGVPAIICGHMALSAIKKKGNVQGRGMAIAGLVLGYLFTLLYVIWLVFAGGLAVIENLQQH